MNATRVRMIVSIYDELRAKSEAFKDVEPCFVEGNEYIAKLWTTANEANSSAMSEGGTPVGSGGDQQGGDDQPNGGDGGDQPNGGDGGDQPNGGDGGDQPKGGDGHGNGGDGGDDQPESPQPPPPTNEPPPTDPEPNPLEYVMKFPSITNLIYGIKVCDTTTPEEALSIQKRLMVGIGVAICRTLMSESGRVGDTVLASKKEGYKGIFELLLLLFNSRAKFNSEGILSEEAIANSEITTRTMVRSFGLSMPVDSEGNQIGEIEEDDDIQKLILADKFMTKVLPPLTIFNVNYFNENQIKNAIDFLVIYMDERENLIVTENYAEGSLPVTWGLIIFDKQDSDNYSTIYYEYTSVRRSTYNPITGITEQRNIRGVSKKMCTTVVDGLLNYTLSVDTIGDEFYKFFETVINNYLNNATKEIEKQQYSYRRVKSETLASASERFKQTINYIENLIQ